MIIVGSVISVKTSPPTKGADLGTPKTLIYTAKPKIPNTIDGTAAKLLIFISIMSIHQLFFGANSSK